MIKNATNYNELCACSELVPAIPNTSHKLYNKVKFSIFMPQYTSDCKNKEASLLKTTHWCGLRKTPSSYHPLLHKAY